MLCVFSHEKCWDDGEPRQGGGRGEAVEGLGLLQRAAAGWGPARAVEVTAQAESAGRARATRLTSK